MRFLLAALLLVALPPAAGCRTDAPKSARECQRLSLPAFPVGANVVDLPDDRDDDPENDGARGYGSAAAARTLDRLKALGLDGVVLPVLLHADSATASEVRPGALMLGEGRARLERMIDQAHDRGFFVALVPHLLLADGEWRGRMKPGPGFWPSYTDAVAKLAAIGEARCAEVLSAGVELKSLSRTKDHDVGFQGLVRRLRGVFDGKLTYSANWDEASAVRHWELFDVVGVNAFHPLATAKGAAPDELTVRAREWQAELLALKRSANKPVWFMEVGFKAVPETWLEPWLWPEQVNAKALPLDEDAQAVAYRAVKDAFYTVPAVDGAFFWVVPSDPDDERHAWSYEPPQGFSFLGKPAEAVVRSLAARPPPRDRYDAQED